MSKFENPGVRDAFAVAITIVGTLLLATGIDPYLTLGSPPLAILINAAIPLVVALLVLGLGGRWLLALPAGALVSALLCVADHFKMQALYNNLLFADLKLIPELAKQPELVMGFAHIDATGWALLVAALLVVGAMVWFAMRRRAIGAWTRVAVAVVSIAGALTIGQHKLSHSVPAIGWMLPMQIVGAAQAGVAGNVLLGALASSNVKPRSQPEYLAEFWDNAHVKAARQDLSTRKVSALRPDIVIVQSESLFEPSLMCGYGDTPVLPTVAQLAPADVQNFKVPVFGHRTLQTEFEVLTGFSVRFAPNSLFSYYELVDRPLDSLPRQLGALGYRTIALHPSKRSFWRRDYAFPAMGFDTFIDGGSYFIGSDFSRAGWVNDNALTRTILSQLDDDSTVPTMVFAVSIENHGPWGEKGPPADESGLEVPASLQGDARVEMLDYVDRARRADQNLALLLETLKHRRRPTMVVFYGDHLPALERAFAQGCFKDGQIPSKHSPPMRVWSNFPLADNFDGDTWSYLLPARILRAAGLPLERQFLAGAIADQIQHDPRVKGGEKRRILNLYAHVAGHDILETPIRTVDSATAFIGREQANDVLLGMQSGGPKFARRPDGDAVRGALWPATGDELTFDLRKRVAGAVIRPWMLTKQGACQAGPRGAMTMDMLADGQLIARTRMDDRAVAPQVLALSGVDKLTLKVHRDPANAACIDSGFEVNQMLCYASACAKPGRSDAHARRVAVTERGDFDAMNAVLARAGAGTLATDEDRVTDMMARATGSEAPYQPIRITPDKKIFMHPTVPKPAWMEFNVEGLSSVGLTPVIQPLSDSCRHIPRGGMVGVDVSVDGRVVERVEVDRNYRGTVRVPLDHARRMRVSVDAGNGVTWCDWASVGFSSIRHAAGTAATGP